MAEALDAIAADAAVSLYLHIPYCREICWYCGCNTGAANRSARLDAYLARLHAEIDLVAPSIPGYAFSGPTHDRGWDPRRIAAAWARGVHDAAPEGSLLRWVPIEVGRCSDCDDNALEPTRRGEPFPTCQTHPPAHPGCRCTLTPVTAG